MQSEKEYNPNNWSDEELLSFMKFRDFCRKKLANYNATYRNIEGFELAIRNRLDEWVLNYNLSNPNIAKEKKTNFYLNEIEYKLDRNTETSKILFLKEKVEKFDLAICINGNEEDNATDFPKSYEKKFYNTNHKTRRIQFPVGNSIFNLECFKLQFQKHLVDSLPLKIKSCETLKDLAKQTADFNLILIQLNVETGWLNLNFNKFSKIINWLNGTFRNVNSKDEVSSDCEFKFILVIDTTTEEIKYKNEVNELLQEFNIENCAELVCSKFISIGSLSKVTQEDVKYWCNLKNFSSNKTTDICEAFGNEELPMKLAIKKMQKIL